jgi:hypothetical protein
LSDPSQTAQDAGYYNIRGDYFVIRGMETCTLNVEYGDVEEESV